jgi:two-component system chemotaxis response regulator CheY
VSHLAVSGGVDPQLEQKTVLIVEDDADLRDSLSDALGLEDYAVLVASNGKEALALLRS